MYLFAMYPSGRRMNLYSGLEPAVGLTMTPMHVLFVLVCFALFLNEDGDTSMSVTVGPLLFLAGESVMFVLCAYFSFVGVWDIF